ncbi:DMT family transporter [Pollutibacter soli]|uniref:DMT family transporter n=1 Tax=Pollutibacter soli TaxID=3034157 RepID=UPI0030135E6C
MKELWIFIALISGAILPIQAGLNARMGKSLESPVHASIISFAIGLAGLLIYNIISKNQISWAGIRSAPWYAWTPGILGAFYVTAIIMAFPRIGAALTFGLVVAGQMLIAILLDHFNVLVAQQHSMNIWRFFGVMLIIAGVIIIRKF